MDPNPIELVRDALRRAQVSPFDPTAVCLATADAHGRPSARIVLLKGIDARGFVFYTNRASRKGNELAANPHAALCFHWPAIGEQIRVEGSVELVSDAEADAYFASRPRESQLGALASRQSRPSPGHEVLLERFRDLADQYEGREVPRPRWWGGYRVLPDRIELWKHGEHRLHFRTLYTRDGDSWRAEMLDP